MLNLTTPTIRRNPVPVQEIHDRTNRLVKEVMDKQWPPKECPYEFPLVIMRDGREALRFETKEAYEHTMAELRINGHHAIQKGIYNRTMREKIDELAELENQTASTGELN